MHPSWCPCHLPAGSPCCLHIPSPIMACLGVCECCYHVKTASVVHSNEQGPSQSWHLDTGWLSVIIWVLRMECLVTTVSVYMKGAKHGNSVAVHGYTCICCGCGCIAIVSSLCGWSYLTVFMLILWLSTVARCLSSVNTDLQPLSNVVLACVSLWDGNKIVLLS